MTLKRNTQHKRIFFVAAEPSGDLLARETVEALRARAPEVELAAIGGAELAATGLASPMDVAPLSILGYIEGIKALPMVKRKVAEAVEHILAFGPDQVVLVDSWGFMMRVAQLLRKKAPHIHLTKLVGPQIWASRSGRAKTLANTVDSILCVLAAELPYYEPYDVDVTLIGNPALARTQQGDAQAFRAAHNLAAHAPMLLVLPGSRPAEIANVAPDLMAAAIRVKENLPDIALVVAPAAAVRAQFISDFPPINSDGSENYILACEDDSRYDAMAAASFALACSGTVTTELAVQGVPMLVAYKVGALTYFLAKHIMFKCEHVTLLNIAAGDVEIIREFLQGDQQPTLMADYAVELLSHPTKLLQQVAAQNAALKKMQAESQPDAAAAAAEAILLA